MKTLKNSLLSLVFISLSLFGLAAGAEPDTNESGCPCSGLEFDGQTWAQEGGYWAKDGHSYGTWIPEEHGDHVVIHDAKTDYGAPVFMMVCRNPPDTFSYCSITPRMGTQLRE